MAGVAEASPQGALTHAPSQSNQTPVQVFSWESMSDAPWVTYPGVRGRFASGNLGTVVIYHYQKGAVIKKHQHVNEQYTYLLSGSIEAVIGEAKVHLNAGEGFIVAPYMPHEWTAIEDTVALEFLAPLRL